MLAVASFTLSRARPPQVLVDGKNFEAALTDYDAALALTTGRGLAPGGTGCVLHGSAGGAPGCLRGRRKALLRLSLSFHARALYP